MHEVNTSMNSCILRMYRLVSRWVSDYSDYSWLDGEARSASFNVSSAPYIKKTFIVVHMVSLLPVNQHNLETWTGF